MADGVLITGVYGCGKSTVAAEMADQLERADLPYAAIDLDWLMWFAAPGVDADASERIFLDNLTAVVANYVRAGVRHIVLAGSVRDERSLEGLRATMPASLRVVRLEVPLDVIAQRLRADPTDARRHDFRVATEWLANGTGAGFEDLAVSNAQPIAQVATTIIDWLGWNRSGPDGG